MGNASSSPVSGAVLACVSAASLLLSGASLASYQSHSTTEGSAPAMRVGPVAHVSAGGEREAHDEVVLAADPNDAGRLLACAMINTSSGSSDESRRSTSYLSADGGRTWTRGPTTTLITADPSCAFAPDGRAYFLTQSSRRKWDRAGTWTLELNHSMDGGRTWAAPQFSAGGDRPWLVVDTASTARPSPIYVTYQSSVDRLRGDGGPEPIALFLKRSTDGGRTWEAPAVRLGEVGTSEVSAVTPQQAVVLGDGTVAVMYATPQDFPGAPPSRPPLTVKGLAHYVATSVDGARTLDAGVRVTTFAKLQGFTAAPDGMATLAVDRSPTFTDRLYAAWGDARTGRGEIWFSASDDKGRTWSSPRIVSDDHPRRPPAIGPDNAMPTLAVNAQGIVGLLWYDRRDNPDNVGFYPRFRASLDGGDTWLPSVRVSDEPNRFEPPGETVRVMVLARPALGRGPIGLTLERHWWPANGHTAGLTADATGAFHALWVDNRTGVNQVYTSRIDVHGRAIRHGLAEWAGRADVTPLVALELNGATLDRETHTITVRGRLRNVSERTLVDTLVMRVLDVRSELGPAHVVNPDEGAGAHWSFSTPPGGLEPGATTAERVLTFEWTPARGVMEGTDVRLGLIHLDVRVLGTTKARTR